VCKYSDEVIGIKGSMIIELLRAGYKKMSSGWNLVGLAEHLILGL
jgi:ABC-type thiamin/hydroxymethylpyrimidine transport system permease subunit